MPAITIALVDDHRVVTRSLQAFLESFDDLRVVGIASSGEELLQRLTEWRPQIVLQDLLMPGGLGSLEEFFEVWTWGQLGLHRKPYGLLNVDGYFDPLLTFLDHAVRERFVRAEHRDLLVVSDDPATLLARLEAQDPPFFEKWIDRQRS